MGWQILRLLHPEFKPNQKMSSGKKGCNFWLSSGWLVRYLAGLCLVWLVCSGLWMIWLVYGLFVNGLAGLWVVSSFTAHENPVFKNVSWRCHSDKQIGQIIFYAFSLKRDSQTQMLLKEECSLLWHFKVSIKHQKIVNIENKKCTSNWKDLSQ